MTLILPLVLLGHIALGPAASHGRFESAPVLLATTLTGKERLTDKGSDEQRVDDCNVPPTERTRPRPTACWWDVRPRGSSPAATGTAPAPRTN